jgi:hypothetical protein
MPMPRVPKENSELFLCSNTSYFHRETGALAPAVSIGTTKQERRKHCVISTGWVCRNVFIFEIHLEITSVENILHYFDTPKPQDGEPGFEMNFLLFSCQFNLSTTGPGRGLFYFCYVLRGCSV